MFNSDKKLAPEPQFSAYLYVLDAAIVEVRKRIRYEDPMPNDQLHDLLDAVHNIPEFISEYLGGGGWFVEDNIKAALASYDQRWGMRDGFRLLDMLGRAVEVMKSTGQFEKRIPKEA